MFSEIPERERSNASTDHEERDDRRRERSAGYSNSMSNPANCQDDALASKNSSSMASIGTPSGIRNDVSCDSVQTLLCVILSTSMCFMNPV